MVSGINSHSSHADQTKYNTSVVEQMKTTDPDAYNALMNETKSWKKFETVEKNLEKKGFEVTLEGKGTRGASWTYESMTITDKAGNSFKIFDANGDGGLSSKDFNLNGAIAGVKSAITAKTDKVTETEKTEAVTNVDKTDAISNIDKTTESSNNSVFKTSNIDTTRLQLQLESYLIDQGFKSNEIASLSSKIISNGSFLTEANSLGTDSAELYTVFNKYIPEPALA
jgi:hypothetical protein